MTKHIYKWAQIQPEKVAFYYNGVSISYAMFARAIEALRIFFEGKDLPCGKTAVVLTNNLSGAWTSLLALRSLGLNTIFVVNLEILERLKVRDPACIVVSESEAERHKFHNSQWKGVPVFIVPTEIYEASRSGDIPPIRSDDPPFGGHIIYTSGTTGVYKKLLMPGVEEERKFLEGLPIKELTRETVHHALDFKVHTAAGFNYPTAIWYYGATVIFDQRPERYEKFFEHNPTYAILVPLVLKQLLSSDALKQRARGKLGVLVGGGFLPRSLAERVLEYLTEDLSIRYGSTECSRILQTRFRTADDLVWLEPNEDRVIQIVDEDGVECPIGVEGKLRTLIMEFDNTSYVDDDEATEAVFKGEYFYPGDMAVRRDDGRIRILGRTQDVLNFHGEKLPLAPVEDRYQNLLRVDELCIFAGLTESGDEELVVAIQADQPPPKEALRRMLDESGLFKIVRFYIAPEFPRSAGGMHKVNRVELRKLAVAEAIPLE